MSTLESESALVISVLRQSAKRYTSNDADIARLAERAFQMISGDPSLLEGPDIDNALFHLVHRIANEDIRSQSLTRGGGDHGSAEFIR